MPKLSGVQHFFVTLKKILNVQQPTTVLNQTICYQNPFHHKFDMLTYFKIAIDHASRLLLHKNMAL